MEYLVRFVAGGVLVSAFAALALGSVAWLLVSILLWRLRREVRLVR